MAINPPVIEEEFTDNHIAVRINANTNVAMVELVSEINAALSELTAAISSLDARVATLEGFHP